MATTIWLLRHGDDLGPAGRFYRVTDELGADYVAKGWGQPLKGGNLLRRPDPVPDDLDTAPVAQIDNDPADPVPGKRGPGRPRKAS